MLWHIVKRELFEQFSSLRFGLAMLLTVILMGVNAVGYVDAYRRQQVSYRQRVTAELREMEKRCDNLYNLVESGPGKLYKQPSKLAFCANGSENHLPQTVASKRAAAVSSLWRLNYRVQPPLTAADVFPTFLKIDWVLITSIVCSFLALVFTFDAISSDIENGTLRLMLSNAVARTTVLNAKFLSALVSLGILFLSGALMNLLLFYLSGTLQLNASDWSRIAIIILVAFIYISLFIALGMLVSSRANRAAPSLICLLLIWVIWVLLIPSILGPIVGHLHRSPPRYSGRSPNPFRNEIGPRYVKRGLLEEYPSRTHPPTPATLLWAEFLNDEVRTSERLNRELLRSQIHEIQTTRNFNRISPTAMTQYAVESLAGTGFQRHLQFLKNVDNYAEVFNEFLISADRADPDSLHVPFVREGMSDKPVAFESIPKFEDRMRLADAFKNVLLEIVLLFLFFAVLFVAAHVSFQNKEI